jgi:hypothetical protein
MSGKFKRALAMLMVSVARQILVFVHRWTQKQGYLGAALLLTQVEVEIAKEQSRKGDGRTP